MKMNHLALVPLVAILSFSCPDKAISAEKMASELRIRNLTKFDKSPKEIRNLLDAALMKDPNNFKLNFLSGLVYDAQSTSGSEGRELARVGYIATLRSDPTFWPANFQLGLLALEDKDAVSATRFFIAAAFHAPEKAQVFYALARAAFCAGDLANAGPALRRAMELSPPSEAEELVTATLVSAASGDQEGAQKWMDALKSGATQVPDSYLQSRVNELLAHGQSFKTIPTAAAAAIGTSSPEVPTSRPGKGDRQNGSALEKAPLSSAPSNVGTGSAPPASQINPTATPTPVSSARRRMATVDVVIIRRKEAKANSSGVNLMDALSLQFGSTLINSGRSRIFDRKSDDVISDSVTTTNSLNLTVPTVTYSLNIANAGGSKSSIEARPTILVYDGQISKLFSGGTLTYAAGGQLSAQSFTKEVGLTLSVTPKFTDADTVTLNISTGLETFITTTAAGSFKEAVQTDKSSTDVTADLRFGDTIVISGGRLNNLQNSNSGVPVVKDVPILGSFFKKRFNSYESNDLLILLSVRREVGGSETGSEDEFQRVVLFGERLWRKLDIAQSDAAAPKREPEAHRHYYTLSNPGRGFSEAYMRAIDMDDDMLVQ